MKKRRGFTLVELLVVIAIIALLMGILMPALAKVRAIAYRMVCGANIGGIGKSMMSYANENNENYPISGQPGKYNWSKIGKLAGQWYESKLENAFLGSNPTITSCLFLVIRTQEATPKQFVCKGDVGTKVFTVKDGLQQPNVSVPIELVACWDFGTDNWPGKFSTYAYHMPFYSINQTLVDPPGGTQTRSFPIVSSSNAGSPVLADRNPYNDKNADAWRDGYSTGEAEPSWDAGEAGPPVIPPHYADPFRTGNSACHQREGQNVLFNDNSVRFEKFPNVGIDNDNIWRFWGTNQNPQDWQKQAGPTKPCQAGTPTAGATDGYGCPRNERDAYLVGEDNRRT